ncbi:uncharacterized protein H6S33_010868 [Morchella sextelata]|uniref:uncharacterized protein n=1 Tax=Morchella sextelata TaxID=1174677 RepID=UPI001D040609|nr:uncharacterized protein H6S33_010868 [Morchella sextelata]KAH0611603.1 hypothetical protein H6S33_010868 [Morchella sextelata]
MSYSPFARCLFVRLVRERYFTDDDDNDTVSNAAQALLTIATDTSAKAKAEEEEQTAYEAMMERVKEAEARFARLRRNMAKNSKRRKITHSGDTDGYKGVSQLSVTPQTRENDEESQKITAEIRRLVKELEALTEETSSMMHDSGVRVVKE